MKIHLKHIEPLGYASTSIWVRVVAQRYWKKIPAKRAAVIVHNRYEDNKVLIEVCKLTPAQQRQFNRNKLVLVPSGCCSVSDKPEVHGETVFLGTIRSAKHLARVLADVESDI